MGTGGYDTPFPFMPFKITGSNGICSTPLHLLFFNTKRGVLYISSRIGQVPVYESLHRLILIQFSLSVPSHNYNFGQLYRPYIKQSDSHRHIYAWNPANFHIYIPLNKIWIWITDILIWGTYQLLKTNNYPEELTSSFP